MSSFINMFYKQKNVIVLALLFGFWCLFLRHAFGADRSFALYMDNEFFVGTILSSMSTSLSNGEWPLRMDTILGGIPLYSFVQLSPFYPFYLTILPIYNSPLDVVHSMHWVILIHILILEINMCLFLRVIGASRLAALFGAALVAFSANSIAYSPWVNIVAPYSWFPLYLAGLVGILQCPQSKKYFAMALAGMVLLTLASPAQPLIHAIFVTIILVATYWYWQLRNIETEHWRALLSRLSRIALVAAVAILLTAPVILPAALEYKNMIRWVGSFPPVMGNDRIPFEAFLTDQLAIADLAGVFFKFKSAAVGSQFSGVVTIALACVAMVSRPRSWLVFALAFILLYSLISSTGSNLGFAYINYVIPMLNKIREPSRFLVLFQLAVGVLAALGLDELRKIVLQTKTESNAKRMICVFALIIFVSVITLIVVPERVVSKIPPIITLLVFAALILITWGSTKINFKGREIMVAVVWGSATLAMLAKEVPWLPAPVSSSTYLTSDALALDMAIGRIRELDPDREYRVIFDGKINKQMAAMLASYQGVRTFNAYFNPAPRAQFEELYYHIPSVDNYYRVLGGKYVICKECTAESTKGYKSLETIAGYEIYETQNVLPRSYIAHRPSGKFFNLVDFRAKAATIQDLTQKPLFVEPKVFAALNKINNELGDGCINREDIRTLNRTRIVVQCKSEGVLVLNEFFDNAWKITVDGVKMRTLRVNGNQMGVPFKLGSHVIEFDYAPRVFLFSLALMFTGIIFCVLIFGRFGKRFWGLNKI